MHNVQRALRRVGTSTYRSTNTGLSTSNLTTMSLAPYSSVTTASSTPAYPLFNNQQFHNFSTVTSSQPSASARPKKPDWEKPTYFVRKLSNDIKVGSVLDDSANTSANSKNSNAATEVNDTNTNSTVNEILTDKAKGFVRKMSNKLYENLVESKRWEEGRKGREYAEKVLKMEAEKKI